ncbi:MAG: AraC family transcriptional regulator [Pseudomonadota bacterium]
MQSETFLPGAGFSINEHLVDGSARFLERAHPTLWSYRSAVVAEARVAERHHPRRVYQAGDFRLTCPGIIVEHTTDEPALIRAFTISTQSFESVLGLEAAALAPGLAALQRRLFRSSIVASITDRLEEVTKTRSTTGRSYLDMLVGAVVLELWRLAGNGTETGESGALSSDVLRRIDQHIDEQGRGRVEAAALARLAGMPCAPFQKLFKETTGQTPFQHVLARRVTNARCLIETTTLSLAEVAYRSGFSSQSHMTDVFRARLGVTPGGIRRALG